MWFVSGLRADGTGNTATVKRLSAGEPYRLRSIPIWEAAMTTAVAKRFDNFAEFYPFYLTEHSNQTCRRLHFVGTSLALVCLIALIVTRNPWWLLAGLVCGYGLAWV